MKKRIWIAILIGILSVGAILIFIINARQSRLIQNKIIKKCGDETEIIIDMSDFTDFEWELCIVYGSATQTKDIQDMFHINYDRTLDLSSGIIFVHDNDVVYEEFFKDVEYDFTGKTPRFLIWPYGENVSASPKCVGFEKEEAIFRCVKEYFEPTGLLSSGYYYYRLYPVD